MEVAVIPVDDVQRVQYRLVRCILYPVRTGDRRSSRVQGMRVPLEELRRRYRVDVDVPVKLETRVGGRDGVELVYAVLFPPQHVATSAQAIHRRETKEHLDFGMVRRDAVAHQTVRRPVPLEDMHPRTRMGVPLQHPGSGVKACRTAADYG